MEKNVRKNAIFLLVLVVVIAFSAVMAHLIERDFGRVEVTQVEIVNGDAEIVVAKMFRPKSLQQITRSLPLLTCMATRMIKPSRIPSRSSWQSEVMWFSRRIHSVTEIQAVV